MLRPRAEERFSRIVEAISTAGWSCCDDFLTGELVTELRGEAHSRAAWGEFRSAAVGAGSGRAVRTAIRSDEIRWLTWPWSPSVEALLSELELLRLALNRAYVLGLFDLELHFACYQPGSAYARHVDQCVGGASRVLSLVLYLNHDWHGEEGGVLRLYTAARPAARFIDFLPHAGRLVSFLSDRFEHEVLPATRERLSVTGWFRGRSDFP